MPIDGDPVQTPSGIDSDVTEHHRRTVRVGPVSWLVRPRILIVVGLSLLVTAALFVVSVGITDYPVTWLDVLRILTGGGTRIENVVIRDDTVPRALVSVLVGFALGMAGSLTQVIARNPLATPDILGITAGAGTAAVAAIAFGSTWGAWLADLGVPAAALIGGFGTAVVMYVLAWPGRSANKAINPLRMVLVGLALTWLLQATTYYLLTRANINDVARAQVWLVGSVANVPWSSVWPVAVAVVLGVLAIVVLTRRLNVLSLGPDVARSLGVSTAAATTVVLLLAVVLAAIAVSAAGPVAFVALIAPQIAMRLTGSATPTPCASGLIGAVLVVAGDILCRTVLPSGLPVGVVTAALGGPFLIYLMITMARRVSV